MTSRAGDRVGSDSGVDSNVLLTAIVDAMRTARRDPVRAVDAVARLADVRRRDSPRESTAPGAAVRVL